MIPNLSWKRIAPNQTILTINMQEAVEGGRIVVNSDTYDFVGQVYSIPKTLPDGVYTVSYFKKVGGTYQAYPYMVTQELKALPILSSGGVIPVGYTLQVNQPHPGFGKLLNSFRKKGDTTWINIPAQTAEQFTTNGYFLPNTEYEYRVRGYDINFLKPPFVFYSEFAYYTFKTN